ncbi:hypothetical protein [Hyphomonas johnsonii]|nr:hypothetical protein [Hyphomonas johnsonii]
MTQPDRPRRYRRPAATLTALRRLAREAAEAGEPLAAIAARLKIPRTTLSGWAREDGFRASDLQAKAAAAAAAETEVDRVRREAEEMVREAGLDADASPVKREVDRARARVSALLDAGHIPEAEADMRKARRLLSLMNFAAPVASGLSEAQRAAHEARGHAFEWRLMRKVCEAWHDGLEDVVPVADGDMRFHGMYMHRCHMVWDINRALFGPDPFYEEHLMEDIYLRAEEGWFNGFRGKIREAVRRLRDIGNDALADSLEENLADEAKAQAAWAEHDAEKGYARPAD